MKKKWTFTITIPNPLYVIVTNWRMTRACYKWNRDWCNHVASIEDDKERFKWSQLVWQEIWMWIVQASPSKVQEEFDWMCKRRGFDERQKECLIDVLQYCRMWKPSQVAH